MKSADRARVFAALCAAALLAALASCGGGGGSSPSGNPRSSGDFPSLAACVATLPAFVPDSSPNVLTVNVDQGPCFYGVPYGSPSGTPSGYYVMNPVNVPYTSITVCVHGQPTNCQTIDHILIDTGSTGVRIFNTALNGLSLPALQVAGSNAYECMEFQDGNSWGSLRVADIVMNGETAGSQTVQVIGDSESIASGVTACKNAVPPGATPLASLSDDVTGLQANGVIGVSYFAQDCGPGCADPANTGPGGTNWFYTCPGGTCAQTAVPVAQQPSNPALALAVDNQGVILTLDAVPSGAVGAANLKGRLIFGLGTQANNGASALAGGASVYVASSGAVALTGAVTYTNGSYSVPGSGGAAVSGFIDSGSNALFLPDTTISNDCTSKPIGWYATPPSPVTSGCTTPAASRFPVAVSVGLTNSAGTVVQQPLTIADAAVLFSNTSDNAFATLGAPAGSGPSSSTWGLDLGLPFFIGKSIAIAIEGQAQTVPAAGTGPYWAF